MKPTKEEIRKWVKALRSGKYKQGKGVLETYRHKFCCLGVACKIFIPEKIQILDFGVNDHKSLNGSFPNDQKYAPTWLADINEDFEEITGTTLSALNDGYISIYKKSFTFDEIADLLELVYIHEMLG